jgi:hypothetical protein
MVASVKRPKFWWLLTLVAAAPTLEQPFTINSVKSVNSKILKNHHFSKTFHVDHRGQSWSCQSRSYRRWTHPKQCCFGSGSAKMMRLLEAP